VSSMDWHWVIPIAITVGIAVAGGIWALVGVVAKISARAATIEAHIAVVLPVAQQLPTVQKDVAVLASRVADHDSDIEKLQDGAAEFARLSGARAKH